MLTALLFAALVPQQPDPATLQRELTQLVDLSSSKARAIAAERLAGKKLATLEQWSAACAAFGEFEAIEAGTTRQTVPLVVLDETEATEIHLYVPRGYDPKVPAPLLLWGHGAGGTGAREHLHWQEIADRIGMFVLAPTEFGKTPGWGSTPRERYAQLAALRWARRRANIDENAVFVGGASRGGHMAWDLALRFPDLWAGALPCIGGPRIEIGERNNMRYLENVAQLPIRDLQGSKDDPLLLANLHLVFDRLRKMKAGDAVLHEFAELGHAFELGVVDWAQFFANRRPAAPGRVVRMAADLAQARAAWIEITAVEGDVRVAAQPRVNAARWDRLDDAGRRALTHDGIVKLTARLEVTDRGQGRFTAKGEGVRSFELWLGVDMLGAKDTVEVKWNGRTVRKSATASVGVLLADFAERFDRTRLAVARVSVP
ncbi:MAG: hypothetical protein KDC98_00745 [Planctomycetes bacterium]|nr:hypothetical protein [Planctomycetota bacterium]